MCSQPNGDKCDSNCSLRCSPFLFSRLTAFSIYTVFHNVIAAVISVRRVPMGKICSKAVAKAKTSKAKRLQNVRPSWLPRHLVQILN